MLLAWIFRARIQATADSYGTDFDSFALGEVHGQDGWTSGHGSSFCPLYDVEVVPNTLGIPGFGSKSLRISNAITCGSFNDQTFSRSLADEAGETTAISNGYSGGTRQAHYEAQWDFASTVPGSEQVGLSVVASPSPGDPGRMSWVQMEDTPTGLQVNFEDYSHAILDFTTTPIGSSLDRTVPHTVKISVDFLDGPGNDVVMVYLDGELKYTGTTWEDYYRDFETGSPHAVDSMTFRVGGTAAPANLGNGFLIDNFTQSSGPLPDVTAPDAITDLAASSPTTSSAVLDWTAPGDDGPVGTASSYDVRYATFPITSDAEFDEATAAPSPPTPSLAGTPETLTVGNLESGVTYYFAVKTSDEVPNTSFVSNSPSLATLKTSGGGVPPDTTPPANVSDLSLSDPTDSTIELSWTAPGDDRYTFIASRYDIRYSTTPIVTDDDFQAATPLSGIPDPMLAGTSQSMTATGLQSGTRYYFAMKTEDEVPNISTLSNVPVGLTLSAAPAASTSPNPYGVEDELESSLTISADKSLISTTGPAPKCTSGALLKQKDDRNQATQPDSTVYYCGSDGKRYVFPNPLTYLTWYPNFATITITDPSVLATIPIGGNVTYRPGSRMLKLVSDLKVYAVAKNGVLRWVEDESVAEKLYGPLWNTMIDDLPDVFFQDYTVGAPIAALDIVTGTITSQSNPMAPNDPRNKAPHIPQ